jgi:hypothetical protein
MDMMNKIITDGTFFGIPSFQNMAESPHAAAIPAILEDHDACGWNVMELMNRESKASCWLVRTEARSQQVMSLTALARS